MRLFLTLLPLLTLSLAVVGCGKDGSVFVDQDEDGSPEGEDCDDGNPTIYPGADELCDGIDNDCDGEVPGDEFVDADFDGVIGCDDCDDTDPAISPNTVWYIDLDEDSYGGRNNTTQACEQPEGYVANSSDCDDTDPLLNPDTTWLPDDDADGYGNPDDPIRTCEQLAGYVPEDMEDCNDNNSDEFPGQIWYFDSDNDSYGDESDSLEACNQPLGYVVANDEGFDCDDSLDTINPGAGETCNGIDDDCDGLVPDDEIDQDGDGASACQGDPDDGNGGTSSSVSTEIGAPGGGTSASWTAPNHFRGNVYTARSAKTLYSFEVFLAWDGVCDVDFYVHAGESASGPWELLWADSAPTEVVEGKPPEGYVSSPPIYLTIEADTVYSLGVAWTDCDITYYADQQDLEGYDAGIGVFEGRTTWDNEYPGFSESYLPERSGNTDTVYRQNITTNY